jgi:hypothetical protein
VGLDLDDLGGLQQRLPMPGVPWLGPVSALRASAGCWFLIRRIGGGGTVGIAGPLLQASFELRNPRLQGPDSVFLLHDQLPDCQRRLFPRGSIQLQPVWKRNRVGYGVLSWVMNLITVRASDAVVIAKNSAERQCEVQGISISVPLTGYPLNNYSLFRPGS